MDNITIKTNHQYRELFTGYELTNKEKQDFDYMDNIDDSYGFFRYKGQVYNLDSFMRFNDSQYDAVLNYTVWSGLMIKLSDCGDAVKVAYYYQ